MTATADGTWERETVAAWHSAITQLGIGDGAIATAPTSVGWRLTLDGGEGTAKVDIDLVTGTVASIEVFAHTSWVKEFDTRTAAQRARVTEQLLQWVHAVIDGQVMEGTHSLGPVSVSAELTLAEERVLVRGLSAFAQLTPTHVTWSFAPYPRQNRDVTDG